MRRYIYIIMLLVFASCGDRHEQLVSEPEITVDVLLPTTPVKDQGRTSLCWIYAMLATIETDCLAKGDSVNLSPAWLARKSIEEQAAETYLCGSDISLRGTLMDAMRLFSTYGIVAYDAAPPRENAGGKATARKAEHIARVMNAQKRGLKAMDDALCDILDGDIGPMPRYVFMYGVEYTALEFAHSCAMPDDWIPYTSFTHHPYGKPFSIEIADNRRHLQVENVPLDSLYNMVVNSLKRHHPVAWEGSLREVKSDKSKVKSEQRQRAFESSQLTDDHCVAIIGMGHKKDGTPVFILKDSWGKDHGRRYMTREEFLLSTILVMIKKQ